MFLTAGMILTTLAMIASSKYREAVHNATVIYTAEAYNETAKELESKLETVEPKTVIVEVEWSKASIEQKIRETFPETPNTAVAVAKCESGLIPDIVGPTSDYGIFQVHGPTWHSTAIELGYSNYRTDPVENIQMARHIYDVSGWNAWVCYKNGWWKNYL